MREGRRFAPDEGLDAARDRFRADLEGVPTASLRLMHPEHVQVPHSEALLALTERTREEAVRRSAP